MNKNIGEQIKYLLAGGYGDSISVYKIDPRNGTMRLVGKSTAINNPSFFCIDASGRFVYSVSEQEHGGEIYAFAFDAGTGQLTFINKQPAGGDAACYITAGIEQKHVFVANYGSGTLVARELAPDGTLGSVTQHIQQQGSSFNPERQAGPHVHTAFLSPDEKHLLYTDLGTDTIHCCRYNASRQPLEPVSVTTVRPGSGPRHIDFSKDGRFVYVVTELSGDVLVFGYHEGALTYLETVNMLAKGFTGEPGGGDIHVSADGRFLYASNRGDANEVLVFGIDQEKGTLTMLQRQSCMGKSPRNLVISPEGDRLVVANQESNNIVVFELNAGTGKIGEMINEISFEQPSCIRFIS